MVCYPSNPTAYVADLDFYRELVPFAKKHGIFVLSDLAYAEVYFDGNPPPSVLQVPGAMDIAVEFTSMSKTYSMPGWRIGFAVGNERIIAALARVKSYLDYGAFTPVQVAATAALNGPDDCIHEMRGIYKRRRDVLVESFGRAGWEVPPPRASMFAWAPIPEPFASLGSVEFSTILVEKAEEILRQFATQIDPALPAILTVHGSVANAVLSSEQSIMMVGHDPIIPLSALTNPAWDYVALGHIHRHQDLHQGAQPPVVYAGSVERIDFGEEREDKGFVWAQVDKGHTTYEFIPGPARRFVTLRLDTQQGDPLQLLDQALAERDIKDAVVRVILTVAPEHSDLIDERQIRERLREAYLLAGIIKEEIKAPARSRDSELTEVLGPLQAVERYIFSHPEYTERRQALLERAQLLLQELQEELLA